MAVAMESQEHIFKVLGSHSQEALTIALTQRVWVREGS